MKFLVILMDWLTYFDHPSKLMGLAIVLGGIVFLWQSRDKKKKRGGG